MGQEYKVYHLKDVIKVSSGVFLGNVLLFCALNTNKCSIVEIEDNPKKVTINLCIKNKTNRPHPIIKIGVVNVDDQKNYVIYTIDRNCTKV